MPIRALVSIWFIAFTFHPALSQTAPKPDTNFGDEAVVVESISTSYALEDDGTSTIRSEVRARVQSEAGVQQFGLINFSYDNSREEVEIQVRVRQADGTVIETPASDIQDMTAEISRSAPMYTDFREKHVAVKGLVIGSTLEYEAVRRTKASLLPGQFWLEHNFDDTEIVLAETLEISVPAGRHVNLKNPVRLAPRVTSEAGRQKFVWRTKNLQRVEDKTVRRLRPLSAVRLTSLSSWQQVGDWYYQLQKDRVQPTSAVVAKAQELTKNLGTDEEKIRAIYDYVATRYRYIAISFGIGVVQPHAAEDVLRNGYGDCKDKHTLLAALLQAVGIKSYPALISSTIPFEDDVPAPTKFDHVITVLPRPDGTLWWMDTTPEVAPFRMLIAGLRGRSALVIRGVGASQIETSPATPPFPLVEKFSVVGKLGADGVFKAKIERSLRSDAELLVRVALHRTARPKWDELVQALSYASGFGGEVSNPIVSLPEDTREPLTITFDYTRKDFGDQKNGYIPDAMPPTFRLLLDEKKTLLEPLPIGTPGMRIEYRSEIELPPGSRPVPPVSMHLDNEFFSYDSEHDVDRNRVILQRELEFKVAEVKPEQVDRLRSLAKQISEHESEQISLRGGSIQFAPTGDSSADALFAEARSALQIQDLDRAMQRLKELVAHSPDYPGAWMMIGSIHQARGRNQEAIEALKKEADLHPGDTRAAKYLAFGYMAMKRTADAAQIWRKLLATNRSDRDAAVNLGNLLLDDKKYAEAEEMLAQSVQSNPESVSLYSSLALAQLRNGAEERALGSMKRVLAIDDSPTNMNDLAYTLAVENRALDQALAWSLESVKRAEEDANHMSLDDLEPEDLDRSRRLGNFWDTLGWIYYRKQQYDRALPYLKAAWELSQIRGIGEHLAEVYEALHMPKDAARLYALAYAANKSESSDARARLRKLVGDVVANRMLDSAGSDLSNLRTIKLPRSGTTMWSGEFFLLFSTKDGIKDVRQVSGDDMPAVKDAIKATSWRPSYPPTAETRLVRRGIAMCSKISGCNLILYPPEGVQSVH